MIYGERIRLRMAEKEDLPQFVSWINDPEVRQGLSLRHPFSMAMEEVWLERNNQREPAEQVLVVEMRAGDAWQMIGSTGFMGLDWVVRTAEIGIMLGEKSEWNKGYGTEVMQLMLKHGFETLNLNRISLRVFSDNHRAIRAYEKTGYVHEGIMRQAEYHDGQYFDVLLMSVLREEWEEKQENGSN